MNWLLFIVGATVSIGASLAVILERNPKRAVTWLLVALSGLAVHFVALSPAWVAAIQVFVYGGTLLTLFYLAFVALDIDGALNKVRYFSISKLLGTVSVVVILVTLLRGVARIGSGALGPTHFVVVAMVLFAIGTAGVLLRRNALTLLMSIEIMLNAASLTFLAYAEQHGDSSGYAIALLVMGVATLRVAVGLVILAGVYRTRQSVDLDELDVLRDEA